MSRYVEKEAFIALLNKRIYCLCGGETVKETRNIRDMLEVFPAADVKPVVRGEWVHGEEVCNRWSGEAVAIRYYKDWHCSECGYIAAKTTINEPTYCFCPNCGAEMREEKDE